MDENQSKEWNYHPNLPLADSSPFTHLTEPMFLLNWIYKNWLSLSERILMVAVAIVELNQLTRVTTHSAYLFAHQYVVMEFSLLPKNAMMVTRPTEMAAQPPAP